MLWPLVILAALLIPLTAVILDSPVLKAWVDRRHGGIPDGARDSAMKELQQLGDRIEALEAELGSANREIAQLKESQQFFQRLLEDPAARQAAARLPKPQP